MSLQPVSNYSCWAVTPNSVKDFRIAFRLLYVGGNDGMPHGFLGERMAAYRNRFIYIFPSGHHSKTYRNHLEPTYQHTCILWMDHPSSGRRRSERWYDT